MSILSARASVDAALQTRPTAPVEGASAKMDPLEFSMTLAALMKRRPASISDKSLVELMGLELTDPKPERISIRPSQPQPRHQGKPKTPKTSKPKTSISDEYEAEKIKLGLNEPETSEAPKPKTPKRMLPWELHFEFSFGANIFKFDLKQDDCIWDVIKCDDPNNGCAVMKAIVKYLNYCTQGTYFIRTGACSSKPTADAFCLSEKISISLWRGGPTKTFLECLNDFRDKFMKSIGATFIIPPPDVIVVVPPAAAAAAEKI